MKRLVWILCLFVFIWPQLGQPRGRSVLVSVQEKANLLKQMDIDDNRRISIDDQKLLNRELMFCWKSPVSGQRVCLKGYYPLSNLLQEITLSEEAGQKTAVIPVAKLYENPVTRVSRMIRQIYWNNLTLSIDAKHLLRVLPDSKISTLDNALYLWVPSDDEAALAYFFNLARKNPTLSVRDATGAVTKRPFRVIPLPPAEEITPALVTSIRAHHGALSLKLHREQDGSLQGLPFVVPGGRFNEMYGWDSYFECLGLLEDGKEDLCQDMVDNFVYQINHYGKILNATRSYYLTRSQPPFLTSMALATFVKLPPAQQKESWLLEVLEAAIKEYHTVWMGPDRKTDNELSRYFGAGLGLCPETEPGHYDPILAPYAKEENLPIPTYRLLFSIGQIENPALTEFIKHDRAVRESGNDTTYRFDNRTADFLPVDLNSLLYKIEKDIGDAISNYFKGKVKIGNQTESAKSWFKAAKKRRKRMEKLFWNQDRSAFFDYDQKNRRQSSYLFASTFYPLWAGWARPEQAKALVEKVLPELEVSGGILASSRASRGEITKERPQRQWDYPYGWAPHQMIAWQGLRNYGFHKEANRLIYKWLYMIATNARDHNGTVPEKFDVVYRTHKVFAEYGNVGTNFAYITKEGFGWVNASYQVGLAQLKEHAPGLLKDLKKLVDPEKLFQ